MGRHLHCQESLHRISASHEDGLQARRSLRLALSGKRRSANQPNYCLEIECAYSSSEFAVNCTASNTRDAPFPSTSERPRMLISRRNSEDCRSLSNSPTILSTESCPCHPRFRTAPASS